MYPKLRNINLFYATFLFLLHLSIVHLQLHMKRKFKSKTLPDVGFTLDWISRTVEKPPTTVSYVTRKPVTPQKQRAGKYFNIPRRKQLVTWIERDPAHRRYTYAQIIHIHGFTCSEATVRRALAEEGFF
jgi:hypothetical protein